MAKMMGRNWKVKPGIWQANEGYPEPCGRAREGRLWRSDAEHDVRDQWIDGCWEMVF